MITNSTEFPYRVEQMTSECKWLAKWTCSNPTLAFDDAKSISGENGCVTRVVYNCEVHAVFACGIKLA
jgi:hypothetical protein